MGAKTYMQRQLEKTSSSRISGRYDTEAGINTLKLIVSRYWSLGGPIRSVSRWNTSIRGSIQPWVGECRGLVSGKA